MKSPEEVKKGLECCKSNPTCSLCPYYEDDDCQMMEADALAYIQQLEQERDTLLADLTVACADVPNPCLVCGHYRTDWAKPGCELNGLTCKWCWRGVQEVKIDE